MTTLLPWQDELARLPQFTPDDVWEVARSNLLHVHLDNFDKQRGKFRRVYDHKDTLVDSVLLINRKLPPADRYRVLLELIFFVAVGSKYPNGHHMMHVESADVAASIEKAVMAAVEVFMRQYPTFLPVFWDEFFPGPETKSA